MTRFGPIAASLSLACLLLAGCSGSGDGDEPTETPTPTATPTSSSTPLLITSVEVTRAPASAPASSKATVCWTVTGTGRSPHTAIHWDDASHANDPTRTFRNYDLGVSYPDNRTSASPEGYEFSPSGAPFCTAATLPASGSIFVIAHAIDSTGALGRMSTEREIRVGPASDAALRIQNFAYSPNPLTVAPGATILVSNMDSQTHTVTGSGGSFDTGDIAGGQTDTFVAPMAPGTYQYGCSRHPTMGGVLEVE